ncbi:MAG TPA: alpha/beta hydrolase [Nevskiaceae bacterium]|nr:alpha/beta hydrolase [Nevskiaceae bacterium]
MRALAQLIDTVPTHWRLAAVQRGPAARSRPDLRFFDAGRALIRYRQAGQGPSLVLGADPPVPLELYDELIERLASRFRVTVFEIPGFGGSLPRVSFRYSMSAARDVIGQFLDGLGGGPHHLALPCVLGYVSIALIHQRPQRIGDLILIQTPDWAGGQRWVEGRDPRHLLRRPVLGQLALAAVRRQRVGDWYRAALADPGQVERYRQATLDHFDHGACFCLASGFQDFLHDHQGLVQPVQRRTLAVWGEADRSHRQTDRQSTLALAPKAELVRFADAGHFPELEQPQRFADLVERFLA